MQKLFEWSEHSSREIRGTGLTHYVGTFKDCLSDQNIKSEALDSHTMLEHAKIVWVIKTFLQRNQRHWTHILYWNIQRLFEWSGHSSWEIRDTGLTSYIGTCKGCLSDQVLRTFLLRNQRQWTHPLYQNMQRLFEWLEHSFWEIRGTRLTRYIRTCKDCLSDQDIKPEALDLPPMLGHPKVV